MALEIPFFFEANDNDTFIYNGLLESLIHTSLAITNSNYVDYERHHYNHLPRIQVQLTQFHVRKQDLSKNMKDVFLTNAKYLSISGLVN